MDKSVNSLNHSQSRSQHRRKQHVEYVGMNHNKKLLNFESKLEKDLQDTTGALLNHMKKHSILSSQNITIMRPIEKHLQSCFD